MPSDEYQELESMDFDDKTSRESLSSSVVDIEVLVDNVQLDIPIQSVEFREEVFEHYRLDVTVSSDVERSEVLSGLESGNARILQFIGKSIVLKIKSTDEHVQDAGGKVSQFQGTIFDVSFNFHTDATSLITLHGIANSFKLDGAKINRLWQDIKRSEIANELIQEGRLSCEIDDSAYIEDFALCYDETRWDFLKRVARSAGHWLYMKEDKVKISSSTSGSSIKLKWGTNLGGLRARIKSRNFKTLVRGWDYKSKKEVVEKGTVSTELTSAAAEAKRKAAQVGFDEESYVDLALTGMAVQKQYKEAAQAKIEGNLSQLIECVGQCNVPGLSVGKVIEISGGGAAWTGNYFITKVTHKASGNGYFNVFEALPVDVAHPEWQEPNPEIHDMLPALVTNLADPDGLGRIRVTLQTVQDKNGPIELPWARFVSPYAGKDRGVFFRPEIDDEVLVAFERGDIHRPIVLGSVWNGKDTPSMVDTTDKNDQKMIYTRSGHQLVFNDKSGSESIEIIDKSGKNLIKIDTSKNTITVNADKDIIVEAKANISLKATGDVSIEGANVNIKAQQGFKAEGMQVDVKAKGMMNLEASGNAKLKAAMLDVDGGSMCNIKGGMINLN